VIAVGVDEGILGDQDIVDRKMDQSDAHRPRGSASLEREHVAGKVVVGQIAELLGVHQQHFRPRHKGHGGWIPIDGAGVVDDRGHRRTHPQGPGTDPDARELGRILGCSARRGGTECEQNRHEYRSDRSRHRTSLPQVIPSCRSASP